MRNLVVNPSNRAVNHSAVNRGCQPSSHQKNSQHPNTANYCSCWQILPQYHTANGQLPAPTTVKQPASPLSTQALRTPNFICALNFKLVLQFILGIFYGALHVQGSRVQSNKKKKNKKQKKTTRGSAQTRPCHNWEVSWGIHESPIYHPPNTTPEATGGLTHTSVTATISATLTTADPGREASWEQNGSLKFKLPWITRI